MPELIKPLGIGDCYDEVVITPDGSVQLRQYGYSGDECKNASKSLEDRLGTVKQRTKKDDGHGGGTYQAIG